MRSLGGGARSAVWLQMKADICGRVFRVPACTEAAAQGAALLAGSGERPDRPRRGSPPREAAAYAPDPALAARAEAAHGRYRRLYAALKPLFPTRYWTEGGIAMQAQNKPRLGVLALMLEGYEPLFPGITARQHAYVEEVVSSLSEVAECVFPRVALGRADIEAIVAGFNAQGLDGILILLLTYSQGQYLVHAMQRNSLPLALTLVQPDETVGDDFEELELTVNQGIHGSQDNANCLLRAGIPCAFFAGSRKNGELAAFVRDFGAAARTVEAMRRMRIGVIGRLPGMGDVVTDDMAVYRVLGPEFVYDSIGTVRRLCAEADERRSRG